MRHRSISFAGVRAAFASPCFVLCTVALCGLSTRQLAAQDALRLQLAATDCGEAVRVELRLENAGALAVAGFQLFLEFPAESFDAAEFEPGDVGGLWTVNGPPPFGIGFGGCGGQDAWGDGTGRDVFSIVASVLRGDPVSTSSIALGTVVFTVREGADLEGAMFQVVEPGCPPLHAETAAFFDLAGERLNLEPPDIVAQVETGRSTRVDNFVCGANPDGPGLLLTWDSPGEGGADVDSYVIYRNGARIATAAESTTWVDETPGACEPLYEVAVVDVSTGELPCRASSSFVGQFSRGDVDGNGLFENTDPIANLSHQFLGEPVDCQDALDFDDSGTLELADAIQLLELIFLGGDAPPAPFVGPGVDPTPDQLCCYR